MHGEGINKFSLHCQITRSPEAATRAIIKAHVFQGAKCKMLFGWHGKKKHYDKDYPDNQFKVLINKSCDMFYFFQSCAKRQI